MALLAFQPSDPEIDRILADPEHMRARERRGIDEAQAVEQRAASSSTTPT